MKETKKEGKMGKLLRRQSEEEKGRKERIGAMNDKWKEKRGRKDKEGENLRMGRIN
jgi:hypothetical protein